MTFKQPALVNSPTSPVWKKPSESAGMTSLNGRVPLETELSLNSTHKVPLVWICFSI